jgi:uncharacterized membrane protein (UPF0127 family)
MKVNKNPINYLKIGKQDILAEVVSDPRRQYLGLSNRNYLCPNCGMLFVFSDWQTREFVMRDMKFSLDIIFIANDRIVNIAEKLPPEGRQTINIYKSIVPVDKVLELPGGYCEKYGIKPGETVIIDN